MRIETQELIKSFYRSLDTDLPFETIKDICYSPWLFVKSIFESGDLEKVRLKYFGVFYVPVARAKKMLKEAEVRYERKIITEAQYLKIQKNINRYLEKFEEDGEEE